jgi:hypothetical protein
MKRGIPSVLYDQLETFRIDRIEDSVPDETIRIVVETLRFLYSMSIDIRCKMERSIYGQILWTYLPTNLVFYFGKEYMRVGPTQYPYCDFEPYDLAIQIKKIITIYSFLL